MNPCANKFTPLSTPILGSSSSTLALHDDHHGPTLERFPSEQIPIQTTVPLHNHPNQSLTPRQTPFRGFSSLYPGIHLRDHAVPQPGWSMPLWYNPVEVAGPFCPTSPHLHPGSFIYGPVVPSLAYADKAFHTVAANSRPGSGHIFDIEQTQTRTQPRRRIANKTSSEPYAYPHREISSQSLVSSSDLLPATASNVMGEPESWKSRECVLKQPPVSAKSTHGFLRHNDCSHLDFGSCLSSNAQQSSECSTSSYPPWSESVVPLFSDAFAIQIGNTTDNARQQCSLDADADSIPQHQCYKESELPPRGVCQNAASPGTSKPCKIPSQDKAPLLRAKVRSCDSKESQSFQTVTSEKAKRKTTAVEHSKQAESSQIYIRNFDSYASDDEMSRLKKQGWTDSVPAISRSLHSKPQIHRNVSIDAGIAIKRSISEHGAPTNMANKMSHKGAFSAIKGPMQFDVASRVGEVSWSQSNRWESPLTEKLKMFRKMIQNLRHIRADRSPSLPESTTELLQFCVDMAEGKKRRCSQKMGRLEAARERRKAIAEAPDEQHVKMVQFLQGKKFPDNLSTVFASRNCFREHISHHDAQWARWPSLAELKEVRDKRPGAHERYLPPPKLRIDVKGYAAYQNEHSYWADRTDFGGVRQLKVDTRFIPSISPPSAPTEPPFPQATELALEELPSYLQKAIEDMGKELDAVDGFGVSNSL
ncbi:hypothetical protein J3459_006719 [Metarhizium acridum]|nr:hypothetical protein J3459_006719 [Metarhizium acridum]